MPFAISVSGSGREPLVQRRDSGERLRAVQMFVQECETGDDFLVQHAHLTAGFLVAGAYFSANGCSEVDHPARKLSAKSSSRCGGLQWSRSSRFGGRR
jgi:hypothetical protein